MRVVAPLVVIFTLAGAFAARPAGAAPAGATAELRRAHQAFSEGDWDRAVKLLGGLEGRLPRVADYVIYLGAEAEFYAGRPARARALFERLASLRASRFAAVAPWRAADCLWAEGSRAAAAAAYRKLLAPPPRRGAATKGKGKSKAKETPPPPPTARSPFVDPAVARFRVAEQAPSSEAARLFLAIYVDFPSHPLAEEAGRRARALAPTTDTGAKETAEATPEDRLRRAEALAAARSYAEAAAELEAMPATVPPELRVRRDFELGMATFRQRRDYARAAELLLGVVGALEGERAAMAAFHGARALSRAQRDDDAIVRYHEVVARFPRSRWAAEAQFLSGWLELNRGRFKQAIPDLRETLVRFPRTSFAEDAAWFLALAHFLAGEPGPALEAFARYEKAAARGSDGVEAVRRSVYFRGRCLQQLGRKEEAVALFREALRRWPLTWYALLARARLREAGEEVPVSLPPRPAALPPVPTKAAADPAIARADDLAAAGLDHEAGVELERDEEAVRKRLGKAPALAALLDRYPRFTNWHRAYQLAESQGAAALGAEPEGTARTFWEAAYPRAFRPLVETYAPRGGNPPLLLFAIMRKESGFSPHVVSYADARGLLQMIPPTSARVAQSLELSFEPDELFVPDTNIRLGATYIGGLYKKFGGQVALAAAAYNGGPRAVMRWCNANGTRPLDEFVELVSYDQTREYAKRVVTIYAHYQYLYDRKTYELPLAVDCKYDQGGPDY